jgi:hypothetical protein
MIKSVSNMYFYFLVVISDIVITLKCAFRKRIALVSHLHSIIKPWESASATPNKTIEKYFL